MAWTHKIMENGNGLPQAGDDVIEDTDNGEITLLCVVRTSCIHTRQWRPNYVYAECKKADTDWDDLNEDEQDRLYDSLERANPIIDEDD